MSSMDEFEADLARIDRQRAERAAERARGPSAMEELLGPDGIKGFRRCDPVRRLAVAMVVVGALLVVAGVLLSLPLLGFVGGLAIGAALWDLADGSRR